MNDKSARHLTIALICLVAGVLSHSVLHAQGLKKIRMGIASMNVSYLTFFAGLQKGFFKDEGIDLELILMSPTTANTAVLAGDLDYNGTPTGVIGGAIRGQSTKVVIFTVTRPLQMLMSRKEITEPRQLRGKKVAATSGAGSTTFMAYQVLRQFGLEPGKDVEVILLGGAPQGRLGILENGTVDAAFLSVPENIVAARKGFNELAFGTDRVDFPQNGFGTSQRRIQENPDEVYRMVRALLRGLSFIWEKKNYDDSLEIILKQYKMTDRKMAGEMYESAMRVMTKDASVRPESVQMLIDLAREAAKITRPVTVAEVYDPSFVDRARRELSISK